VIVKAYRFVRAFVLWFALFCVIVYVFYVSVLPLVVNLVSGSN
jgi:hypothetical protein